MSTPPGMNRERLDQWCEWGVVGLVLAQLVFAPLALGAVRPSEFLVLQALTMLVLVLWLLRFWLNPRPHLLWPPACWGVAAFAGYALIRYWFADLEYVARQEMARVLLYTVLFLACVNNLYHQGSIRLVVYVLVLMGTGEAAMAVVQFFTHPSRIWGFARLEEALGRGSGTYFCADHLAGFLEMILPLALAYTVGSRSRALLRVLLGYACLVMAAGIVSSQSRGGWISAAFGLVLLLALLVRTTRQGLALVLFVGFLFGSGFLVYSHSIVLQLRVAALRRSLARMEFDTRYGQMAAAWKMWKDHPWFGVGPAHYDVRYDNYRAENGLLQKRPRRVHNDYLNTLADWGAVGAACLAWAAAALGLGLARHWRRLRRLNQEASSKTWNVLPFLAGAVAGVGALLLHSLVDFNMHIPANAILAVVLLALLASQWRFTTDRYWVSITPAARLAASLLLLAGLVFFGLYGWRLAREDRCLRRAGRETTLSPERLTALQQAFAVEPANDETAYLIAEQYWWQVWLGDAHQLDYLHAAMDWFQRAAHLNPFAPEARLGMGACLDWLNRPDEAKAWFQQALVLDPNGLRTRVLVGAHYFQAGDCALAIHWLSKALYLDPESSLARHYYFLTVQKMEEEKKNPSTPK